MSKPIRSLLFSVALLCVGVLAILCTTGCKPQRVHPGQLSAFDGAAYDSLTLAHGALQALRAPVADHYPNLKVTYNRMASAYNDAIAAYRVYRVTGDAAKVDASSALHRLTLALVLLETDLLPSLERPSAKAHASIAYSPSELLDELQMVAAIASTFRGTQAEVQAASVILDAARGALSAWSQVSGQPIDIQTLTAIELL